MTTSNGTASISFDYLFPTLTESDPHVKPEEGTTAFVWPTHPRARLAERVDQLCRYARYSYSDLDIERLALAQNEANVLIHSGVFSERLSPDVNIDPYGEISFTHQSPKGYVDIGVRGESELSYHIRNDIEPSATSHDDYAWDQLDIPSNLLLAVENFISD